MSYIDKILAKIDGIRKQSSYKFGNDPENIAKISSSSLLFYYGNIHSQRGQDGILAEIFRRIGVEKGFFVEFGAWDGNYLANSRRLYEMGWSGLFIEGDAKRFKKLVANYQHRDNIFCIKDFVGAPEYGVPGRNLREIMASAKLDPDHIDFLSVDIDGYDLEVFLGSGVKPKVVLLEGGFNFTPAMSAPIPANAIRAGLQHHIAHIAAKVQSYGYQLICFYQDSFLVRSDLASLVSDEIRSPVSLYSDAFHFMPDEFRDGLLELRRRHGTIQAIEKAQFDFFRENPIHPDYLSK